MDASALIQGLTEFLPVSSSLHLELWALWQNLPINKDNEVSLHAGTLIALCLYFIAPRRWPNIKTISYATIATLPAIVVGFYIKKSGLVIPHHWLAYSTLTGGIGLWLAEKKASTMVPRTINASKAIAIGLAQILAFIPGASRMGTTITMSRLLGVSVRDSINFSWLLAIPTVGGAVFLTLFDAWKSHQPFPLHTADIVITAMVGWITLTLVDRYAGEALLKGCAYYRIGLGVILWFLVTLNKIVLS